jgi:hypothetical protein
MRPKSALFYVDKLNLVNDDFVSCIKRKRDKKDLVITIFCTNLGSVHYLLEVKPGSMVENAKASPEWFL